MQYRNEVTAYVGLGANLGDASQALKHALIALGEVPGVRLVKTSRLYRTAPVDAGGPDYLNAVAEVATTLTAPALLSALQAIEQQAGRERPYRHAPRTLDLDLLLFGRASVASPSLNVPHPRMASRAFVLVPLAEIAPLLIKRSQLDAVAGQRIERLPG